MPPKRFENTDKFIYYGNYAGPNYSAGKYNASIKELIEGKSIDPLDEAAKEHDMYYALGMSDVGDDILIKESNKLYGYKDIAKLLTNPLLTIYDIYNQNNMGSSALGLNAGFRLKQKLGNLGIELKKNTKDPRITMAEENQIKDILRKKTLNRAYKEIGADAY